MSEKKERMSVLIMVTITPESKRNMKTMVHDKSHEMVYDKSHEMPANPFYLNIDFI